MKKIYSLLTVTLLALFIALNLDAQDISFNDSWAEAGFNLSEETSERVEIIYSIENFSLLDVDVKGTMMKSVHLPAALLPNNEGAPDLAGMSQHIAVPAGAKAVLNIIDYRTETYQNVEVAPAPRIPLDTDNSPPVFIKDQSIYSKDVFYPAEPFLLSKTTTIRGVDAVMLGITPFQYNPVSKELIVYRDIQLEVVFEGGSSQFGDNRYRNRWFDPILQSHLINYASLPQIEYTSKAGSRSDGYEYVIITLDDPDFLAWADTLKTYRNMQGISTGIYTVNEIGGNHVDSVEHFIDNAYNNWTIPPIAVLIMADYGSAGNGILSPIWDYYCASDHIYGDVNENGMADVIMARMTAQNATDLENMIGKIINYENDPPTYESYYNPITALGWQTERWFQICSESIGGYFKNVKGKNPVRINEVYGGNPTVDPWSTATNTNVILNVFGPNGLGYIPASPTELGAWDGGTGGMINDAINAGSFIIQHRDHGSNTGWGEPSYNNGSLDGLDNDDPIFVFSINCLTGKYNWSSECFTEKFHRMEKGALGLIAASEVSYSFVNDTYVWGLYDYMWTDFLPQFGPTISEERGMLPAFANVAGKYFLEASSWPYNAGSKEVTYNLFHHHGCAFQTLYSEVPMNLTVVHDNALLTGSGSFTVSADSGAFIALSHNGELLGTGESDGTPQAIAISLLEPGDIVDVVVTKPNYFRYHATVDVIPANMPYVIYDDYIINDAAGNGDGQLDYGESVLLSLTLENVGLIDAIDVSADISTENENITISDNTAFYGDILPLQTATVTDEYAFEVAPEVADGEILTFNVEATDGDSIWNSFFMIEAHAPILNYLDYKIEDPMGNGNERLDPGETADITVTISNDGSSDALNASVELISTGNTYITINSGPVTIGDLTPANSYEAIFSVTAAENTPGGYNAFFDVGINADLGISGAGTFDIIVGKFSALILDLDPLNQSGPVMMEAIEDLDLMAYYATSFPEDLGIYKSVFVSLGLLVTGHELTAAESDILVNYVNNGGRLYMEGSRTWYGNEWLPIHDKFNIETVVDFWFEYDTINGQEGTFTEGMIFEYESSNPYNNYYILPKDDAFTIFTSPEAGYGCAVAYDEGNYKTIGSVFEFGKLADGASPATKQRLMLEYLSFFGDILTGLPDDETSTSAFLKDAYPNPFTDQTTIMLLLDKNTPLTVEVYDLQGMKVATIAEGRLDAGEHYLSWDGTNDAGYKLGSGIYLCTLKTNSVITTKKLILH